VPITHLNPRALLLQPKCNNFTPNITRKDLVIFLYVLSLHGLPLPPMCVCVTAIEAHSYCASIVLILCC
jgi:hypothetical protein